MDGFAVAITRAVNTIREDALDPRVPADGYGYLVWSEIGKPPTCKSYVSLFRNGTIEAVWTVFSRERSLLIHPLEREIFSAMPDI